jgi:hypothetical protein
MLSPGELILSCPRPGHRNGEQGEGLLHHSRLVDYTGKEGGLPLGTGLVAALILGGILLGLPSETEN